MPQIINTNIMSMNSQRNLNRSQDSLQVALQRLSSGLRLNSAKDDAAGLAITERFTTQIRGLAQATRNAADGISLAQVAEGAMQEIANNLQRMRELAIQAANATNSAQDRVSLDDEVTALELEMVRVFDGTEFNGVKVLATSTVMAFQVGPNEDSTTNMVKVTTNVLKTVSNISVALKANIQTVTGALCAILRFDMAIDEISARRATWGTTQNRFESIIRNNQNIHENTSASRSRIQDADFAAETAALARAQVLQQAGVSMVAQANALPQNVLSLLQ